MKHEQTVFYHIDTTGKSCADYENGADMQWSNYTQCNGKAGAIREAKRIFANNPEIYGIRVDRNCLKEGSESLDTIFTLFR